MLGLVVDVFDGEVKQMSARAHMELAASWVAAPTAEIAWAAAFYKHGLETKLAEYGQREPARSLDSGNPGAIVTLTCSGDLNIVLERVVAKGGTVLVPKTAVPHGPGHIACIRDREGNHIGLHSDV